MCLPFSVPSLPLWLPGWVLVWLLSGLSLIVPFWLVFCTIVCLFLDCLCLPSWDFLLLTLCNGLRCNNTDIAEYDHLLYAYFQVSLWYKSATLCTVLHLYAVWTCLGHASNNCCNWPYWSVSLCICNIYIVYYLKLLHLYYHYSV